MSGEERIKITSKHAGNTVEINIWDRGDNPYTIGRGYQLTLPVITEALELKLIEVCAHSVSFSVSRKRDGIKSFGITLTAHIFPDDDPSSEIDQNQSPIWNLVTILRTKIVSAIENAFDVNIIEIMQGRGEYPPLYEITPRRGLETPEGSMCDGYSLVITSDEWSTMLTEMLYALEPSAVVANDAAAEDDATAASSSE